MAADRESTTRFRCDYAGVRRPLPHFWEYCVGSGHATLALRADWQTQLRRCREELGFRHVRFHGLLDDAMGTLVDVKDTPLYSFHNVDQVHDFLRSIDMRPMVELSFMPRMLASSSKTVFHYNANVTPPCDYGNWAALISRLARHWVKRYGAEEVSRWPIEVWNEPNLQSFWTGSKAEYFKLFDFTYKALKHVHPGLRVGGPVTAKNAWIDDFLQFCEGAKVPPDFVSTHTYPTDAFGSPGDDTVAQLAAGHLGILHEQAREVRRIVGDRPLYYTEWSTSSNSRDELHDAPYAAAYIVHTLLNMGTLVDAYSYWTFSDIFSENYFPSKPFQGGFGLLTIHGVPKPAYRAYQVLHALGTERLEVAGNHDTVFVWVIDGTDGATVMAANLALPTHPIRTEAVVVELRNVPTVRAARLRRIDAEHANARARWKIQGEPCYPGPEEVGELLDASRLRWEAMEPKQANGVLTLELTVKPQSVTAIELSFAATKTDRAPEPDTADAGSRSFDAADEKLLEQLQRGAFGYFHRRANAANGLVPDSSAANSPCSIAATGFALSCYPIAVERGWLARDDAAAVTLRTLRFLADSRQGPEPDATGYKGFYYHFLEMKTGKRAWECELSTIDTAILLAGVTVAREFFDGASAAEASIRAIGAMLFARVDWSWIQDSRNEIQEAWKPEAGFEKADWAGYTEALILYLLGAASPSRPLAREVYEKVTASYRWRRNDGLEWIYAGPLFIHLFPQVWVDLRGLDDGVIGRKGIDYFENSRRAIGVQRDYARLNPWGFPGYGDDIWGLSACLGPSGVHAAINGEKHRYQGYAARGAPCGPDDGTLVPWAAAASLAHAPKSALAGLHALLAEYPHCLQEGCFVGAFNPSLPGRDGACWIAPACYGLDQGLVVTMIENARSGFLWKLTRNSPVFRAGLQRLGFRGGWLD
jgi:xylan 1,4-beta-xylosidase